MARLSHDNRATERNVIWLVKILLDRQGATEEVVQIPAHDSGAGVSVGAIGEHFLDRLVEDRHLAWSGQLPTFHRATRTKRPVSVHHPPHELELSRHLGVGHERICPVRAETEVAHFRIEHYELAQMAFDRRGRVVRGVEAERQCVQADEAVQNLDNVFDQVGAGVSGVATHTIDAGVADHGRFRIRNELVHYHARRCFGRMRQVDEVAALDQGVDQSLPIFRQNGIGTIERSGEAIHSAVGQRCGPYAFVP